MTIDHLTFLSRREAEAATPSEHIAVISITEPFAARPRLDGWHWHRVLRLEFHDIDPGKITDQRARTLATLRHELFTHVQAREIIAFVRRIQSNGVAGIMVHGEAGTSRSAAVARWIADRHGLPLSEQATAAHNRYVYRMLEEAVG